METLIYIFMLRPAEKELPLPVGPPLATQQQHGSMAKSAVLHNNKLRFTSFSINIFRFHSCNKAGNVAE